MLYGTTKEKGKKAALGKTKIIQGHETLRGGCGGEMRV